MFLCALLGWIRESIEDVRLKALADASTAALVGDEQLRKDSNSHLLVVAHHDVRLKSCAGASSGAVMVAGEEVKVDDHVGRAVGLEEKVFDDAGHLTVFWSRRSRDTCEPSCDPRQTRSSS